MDDALKTAESEYEKPISESAKETRSDSRGTGSSLDRVGLRRGCCENVPVSDDNQIKITKQNRNRFNTSSILSRCEGIGRVQVQYRETSKVSTTGLPQD